jgi:hypothetical protein
MLHGRANAVESRESSAIIAVSTIVFEPCYSAFCIILLQYCNKAQSSCLTDVKYGRSVKWVGGETACNTQGEENPERWCLGS